MQIDKVPYLDFLVLEAQNAHALRASFESGIFGILIE